MSTYVETAAQIAQEAGQIVQRIAAQRVGFELKGEHDLVTEADRASERHIVERLRAAYPDHSIVAEEGGNHTGASGYRWYVDPLDGTTNFAHRFPAYNVTLALERDGEIIAGVVLDPCRNEIYTAERGGGAFLNGERMHVSTVANLRDSLVATGFPSRKRHKNVNVHFFYQLSVMSHGVRRPGAAALDLAFVAAGRLDMFWEFSLNPWDMAAGTLLVEEAGGRISDMHGAPLDLRGPHILASNGLVHQESTALFADIFAGKYQYSMPGTRPDET